MWYDYNVNKDLAVTPRSSYISATLLFWTMTKIGFFIVKNMLINRALLFPETFLKTNKLVFKMMCQGVPNGLIPFIVIDALQDCGLQEVSK